MIIELEVDDVDQERSVVLAIRILGVCIDGTASQNLKLIVAEVVLVVLSVVGLFIESFIERSSGSFRRCSRQGKIAIGLPRPCKRHGQL